MSNITFKANYLEHKISSEDQRHYQSKNNDFYYAVEQIRKSFQKDTAIIETFFIYPETNYFSLDVKITATSLDFEQELLEAYKVYHQCPLFHIQSSTP